MASLLGLKHDQVTRELLKRTYDSTSLWKQAKVYVQEMTESKDTIVLSFDDSIQEKQYTDQNELNCWHYDPVFGRSVKRVHFLIALVEVGSMRFLVLLN